MIRVLNLGAVGFAVALAFGASGCSSNGDESTPTTSPAVTTPTASLATGMPAPSLVTATPSAAPATATATPSPGVIDPCTTRLSLEGQALDPGASFALTPQTKWQLCLGGAAAGSSEKYLFRTTDGGSSWTLVSRTTLGNPPPEQGVGDLPNGNAVVQILFLDASKGWMGLNSPGDNLFRSQDGGVSWSAVTPVPPGVPVTSIAFTDALHGTVVTSESSWVTEDGGVTWIEMP